MAANPVQDWDQGSSYNVLPVSVSLAIGENPKEPGTPVINREVTLDCLVELLTQHDERGPNPDDINDPSMLAAKNGPYFCAAMAGGQRNSTNVMPWNLFCLDFDGKHDSPDPGITRAFFADTWHIGYSSHRYRPDNGKHRIVLLLDRAVDAKEYRQLFDALAAILPYAPDNKLNHPDQPVFLPSCPIRADRLSWQNDGKALCVDAILEQYRKQSAQESRASKAYRRSGDSVIAAFNDAHDLTQILESHGYVRKGRRYLHPQSESGIAGLSILGNGTICFSHASDALGDGKAHDAFDVFRILGHGGDMQKAVRVAAEMLGITHQGHSKAERTPCEHTQPEPLRAPMPKAEPYPVEYLGEILGAAAQALHEVIKAPLALCCQSVLGSASLAAQSHFDVKLPWGSTVPLSLFLLTVGESGERKSAVDDMVLGAAKEQQKAEMREYTELLKEHEAASVAWNQALDAAKKAATSAQKRKATAEEIRQAMDECGEKPTPPISPMRFVTDPTVEGLFKLLAIGQPSVALFSDEGGLLIGGHALNSDNALKTMARWCKLWDGSPFDRVRSGDGSGILYGRRMALHQLAQPDVMVKLLSDPTANGQGFLARCLTAWPTSTIGTRQCDGFMWAGDRIEVRSMYGSLKVLMEAKPLTSDRDPQELTPIALPLTAEAQSLAVEALNFFEHLMATGNDLAELRDRGSKALENACRIAGVLAVVEGGMATREISRTHLDRGVNLIQWYLNEALRIRSAAVVPQSVIDAESMLAWLKDRDCKIFRTATLLTHGPSQLRNKKRLDDAIDEAVKCGYLAEQEPGTEVDGVKAKRSWRVLHYVV